MNRSLVSEYPYLYFMFLSQVFKGKTTIFSFVLTILLVVLAYIFGQWPIFEVANYFMAHNNISSEVQKEFYRTTDFSVLGMPDNLVFALMVIIFVFAAIGLYIGIKCFHKREFKTIITSAPSIRWGRIIWAFMIWVILTIIGEAVFYAMQPTNYVFQFDASNFMILLVLVLLFIPLQASFEEWFVRGYLMQLIGLIFEQPWVAIIMTSLAFGAMHLMNPEVHQFGLWTMMLYYVSVALFFAIITILDDGLELAMGMHIATNVYGSLFVAYEGSVLRTPALFEMHAPQVGLMTLVFFISALIFFIFANRKYKIGKWRKLTQPVINPHEQDF